MNKKDISISDLYFIFRRRWWLILICAMIVAVAVGAMSIKFYSPEYKTNILFYVKANNNDSDNSINNDINSVNWALKVINSYTTLIHTNSFSDNIIDEYVKKFPEDTTINEYTGAKIKTMVAVTTVENTNLFKVTVTASSAEFAYNIAKCIENITGNFIKDKTGVTDAVTIADPGQIPTKPDNSNHMRRNTALAFIVGAAVMYLILFFIELFDVRIKSEEDLLNNYTLPILGTVPTFEAPANRKKVYKYGD